MNNNITTKNSNNNIKIISFLLFLYFLFKPFYFFGSGNPQVSDFIFLMILVYCLFFEKKIYVYLYQKRIFKISIFFITYIIIINSIWTILISEDISILFSSLWYAYNVIVFWLISLLINKYYTLINKIIKYISFSVLVQFIILIIINQPYRSINFFNNPNQLGYYALLSLSFLMIPINPLEKKYFHISYIFKLLCFILAIVSLSKASIIISFLILYFNLFLNFRKSNKIKLILIILIVVFISLYFNPQILINTQIGVKLLERLSNIGTDHDDNFSSRGYDRIINQPEYLFFGAGEGKYSRFDSIVDIELHSTLGNLFFSYGIIGLASFIKFLYCINKRNNSNYFYILVGILGYGITHNGIRQTMFWILLSLMMSINNYELKSNNINE